MSLGMELDYRLRWMDFDQYGRLQPSSALDIFQDAATIQAEDMGIGRDSMVSRGVFWAVVRIKLEIVKPPAQCQVVTVRTWPHTPTRFSFLRDFTMRDASGDLLVKATSEWVLMDIESLKLHFGRHTDTDRMFQDKEHKTASGCGECYDGDDTSELDQQLPAAMAIEKSGFGREKPAEDRSGDAAAPVE